MQHRRLRAQLAVVALVSLAVGVGAGELARTGTYSSTVVSEGSYEVVQLTEGVGAAVYRYTTRGENASGVGFMHGLPGHCIGIGIYEQDVDHESGYCAYVDADGHRLFERYEHYGQVGRGSGSSLGGTGKYGGIQATYEYRFEALDPEATSFRSTALRTGRYRLRRP